MKYILLIGTRDAGKSTTVDAVCKILRPKVIKRLQGKETFTEVGSDEQIHNGTYLIEVNGKSILVVAGAPTEQGIRITILVQICIELDIKLDFALVAMRSYERSEGFNTREELEQLGECVHQESIYKIPGEGFRQTDEWKGRIDRIVNIMHENL